MKKFFFLAAAFLSVAAAVADEGPPRPLIEGLKGPASVAVGQGGKVYVAVGGESGKDDGAVLLIENNKAVPFAAVADDPRGMVAYQQWLFVAGRKRLWRIDKTGLAESFVAPNAFPSEPQSLAGLAADQESGMIYVSDSGDAKGKGAAIYRVTPLGLASLLVDAKGQGARAGRGLWRWTAPRTCWRPTPTRASCIGSNWPTAPRRKSRTASARSPDWRGTTTAGCSPATARAVGFWSSRTPGDKPAVAAKGFRDAAGLCLDASGGRLLVADRKAGTLTAVAPPSPAPRWTGGRCRWKPPSPFPICNGRDGRPRRTTASRTRCGPSC